MTPQQNQLLKSARKAVTELRDYTRTAGMGHHRRDPLVLAIHAVIDAYDEVVSEAPPLLPQQEQGHDENTLARRGTTANSAGQPAAEHNKQSSQDAERIGHTRGPWFVGEDRANGIAVFWAPNGMICPMRWIDGMNPKVVQRVEADAYLIAQAPRMLEVLKEFMRQDAVRRATYATDIGLSTAADHALEVIAQAEHL